MTAILDTPAHVNIDEPQQTPLRLARRLARIPDLRAALPVRGSERTWLKLRTDVGWDAWLIGWPPGARTGWHDHQGSAGAFVVLDGSLSEWSFPAVRASRTADAPAAPVGAADVRHGRFAAGAGRGFAHHHIHEMANETGRVAYSVHAYAPELTAMASYVWTQGRLTRAGLETGESW